MRKKYKNQLFNLINNLGFSPNDFTIDDGLEGIDSNATLITYKETPFIFSIWNSEDSYDEFEYQFVKYGPDFPESPVYPDQGHAPFSSVGSMFSYWIEKHIKEFELDEFEPDLWSEYKSGNSSLNFNEIDFNDKVLFSMQEKKQISMAINELKLLICKNFNTSSEEQYLVNERLEYLIESSKKLNKFDWKSLVLSTIIGISTTLTLDVEKGKMLYELFRQVFISVKNIAP